MMIGSLMMIKIINNIEHYSFFFMALANTDQPPALNNVHQTTPSGETNKLKMKITNDERRRKETDGKETPKPATEEDKARPV